MVRQLVREDRFDLVRWEVLREGGGKKYCRPENAECRGRTPVGRDQQPCRPLQSNTLAEDGKLRVQRASSYLRGTPAQMPQTPGRKHHPQRDRCAAKQVNQQQNRFPASD
jgi:hypothetical protein